MTITEIPTVALVTDEPTALFNETPANHSVDAASWRDLARCSTAEDAARIFFSDENADLAAAKLICASCEVVAPCLEGALERGEAAGVWGGQLFNKGQIVAVKRRRGRPPKVARPEDELPQVPIPAHLQKLIA